MTIYKVEDWTPALHAEIDALTKEQRATTVAGEDVPPLDYDIGMYQLLADAEQLMVITARTHDWLLVGFTMYVLSYHQHYRGLRIAECDSLTVRPTMWGKGIGGNLLDLACEQLKDRGVKWVVNKFRTIYPDKTPLFTKHGFELVEHVYRKVL